LHKDFAPLLFLQSPHLGSDLIFCYRYYGSVLKYYPKVKKCVCVCYEQFLLEAASGTALYVIFHNGLIHEEATCYLQGERLTGIIRAYPWASWTPLDWEVLFRPFSHFSYGLISEFKEYTFFLSVVNPMPYFVKLQEPVVSSPLISPFLFLLEFLEVFDHIDKKKAGEEELHVFKIYEMLKEVGVSWKRWVEGRLLSMIVALSVEMQEMLAQQLEGRAKAVFALHQKTTDSPVVKKALQILLPKALRVVEDLSDAYAWSPELWSPKPSRLPNSRYLNKAERCRVALNDHFVDPMDGFAAPSDRVILSRGRWFVVSRIEGSYFYRTDEGRIVRVVNYQPFAISPFPFVMSQVPLGPVDPGPIPPVLFHRLTARESAIVDSDSVTGGDVAGLLESEDS